MEEQYPLLYQIAVNIGLPIVTLFAGWFGNAWRSKQKKEADVLQNVMQILDMQKKYIADQDAENRKTRNMNIRLEKKLDEKRESIRKANKCQYTNEGDGCPVLNHEDLLDEKCKSCKYKDDVDCEVENR